MANNATFNMYDMIITPGVIRAELEVFNLYSSQYPVYD